MGAAMEVRAALDVGSNSIKLVVLEIGSGGTYKILHDEYAVTGLGTGLTAGGDLQPQAVADSLQCIEYMVGTAQAFGASTIVAAGTAALRKAADSQGFVDAVYKQTGVRIDVVSADDEARLSRTVAMRELQGTCKQVVFFDVGGGSTELTWCEGDAATRVVLMPLGARQLTEAAQISQPVSAAMDARLAQCVSEEFSKHEITTGGLLAGLGGTAVTLTRLLQESTDDVEQYPAVVRVDAARISEMLTRLRKLDMDQVEALLAFDPKRAPVIYAGAYLLNELLTRFSAEEFLLVDRGLRFGLLLPN